MSPFEQYLIDCGFKRYRMVYGKGKFLYEPSDTGYSFSSMEPGGLDYRYLKNGKEVVFGLSEESKPPTLCWPRPQNVNTDDEMNRVLKEKTTEQVYKMIFTN